MSRRRRRCACGRLYFPVDKEDNICPHCRKWHRLLFERNVLKFERARMKYNATYGTDYTYGKFVLFLENIERKIKR